MTDQVPAGQQRARQQSPEPLPVTPSDEAGRPEGLAFDVEPGADLTGVPTGDQIPRHPGASRIQETVTESGEGVGLAVPRDHGTADEE